MNEKLQTELTTWLQAIRENGEGAKEFALAQAPDIVREMVALGRLEMTVLAVSCVALIGITIRFMPRWIKTAFLCDEATDAQSAFAFGAALLSGIGSAIAMLLIVGNLHDLFAAWFAPRVYVLEQAATMLGKMAGK